MEFSHRENSAAEQVSASRKPVQPLTKSAEICYSLQEATVLAALILGGIAQSVEQTAHIRSVIGSSPIAANSGVLKV